MLLTIDTGNTQTVIGLYRRDVGPGIGLTAGDGLVDHWRLSTDAGRTSDEYAVLLRNFLDSVGYDMDTEVTGVAMCSGVPRVLANLRQMVSRYLAFDPVVIEPGTKTGMPILYDNPKEVGADRIANAVAAHALFPGAIVVVDFGTGTNFDVISKNGEFVGGAIAPGIEVSLDALFGRGAIYGFTALVDGMVERFRRELGGCTVVATGGLAHLIAETSVTIQHLEPFLTLHGLRLVHEKNTR
jgi:type III pantothenate kinase